jgi:hypothetical protein
MDGPYAFRRLRKRQQAPAAAHLRIKSPPVRVKGDCYILSLRNFADDLTAYGEARYRIGCTRSSSPLPVNGLIVLSERFRSTVRCGHRRRSSWTASRGGYG